jgi:drug/metabolite transporter (DMT)-like permease
MKSSFLSDKRRAEVMLIGITVVWGLTFALVKKSLNTVEPFTFMAWRFWIAAVVMGALSARHFKDLDMKIVRDGMLLGVLLYASYSFQTFGLKYTTAGNAGFITGLFIVFTPLLAAIFLKHKPNMMSMIAVAVALIGLGFLSIRSGFAIRMGDALVLVCAFLYSVHIVLLDGYTKKYDLLLLTFTQMLIVAVMFTISGLVFEHFAVPKTGFVWMSLLVCGLLASAAAFYVQGYAQRILTPTRTSMVLIMEPVFSVIFGIIILSEHLTWRMWVGCALILAGMLLTEIPLKRKAGVTEPESAAGQGAVTE